MASWSTPHGSAPSGRSNPPGPVGEGSWTPFMSRATSHTHSRRQHIPGGIGRSKFGCYKTGTKKTYQFPSISQGFVSIFPPRCSLAHGAFPHIWSENVPNFSTSKFVTTKLSDTYAMADNYDTIIIPRGIPKRAILAGGGSRERLDPAGFHYAQQIAGSPPPPSHPLVQPHLFTPPTLQGDCFF